MVNEDNCYSPSMACISRVLGALRGVRDPRDTQEEELFSFLPLALYARVTKPA